MTCEHIYKDFGQFGVWGLTGNKEKLSGSTLSSSLNGHYHVQLYYIRRIIPFIYLKGGISSFRLLKKNPLLLFYKNKMQ
jgi:hypothetical protein